MIKTIFRLFKILRELDKIWVFLDAQDRYIREMKGDHQEFFARLCAVEKLHLSQSKEIRDHINDDRHGFKT